MSNLGKKAAVAILSLFFAISSISAALAHNFTLVPDKFGVSVGESTGIAATFTHEIGKGQYPVFGLTKEHTDPFEAKYVGVYDGPFVISADISSASFKVHYNDGQETQIPESSFSPYDLDKGEITDARISDSDHASFLVTQAGTAAVAGDIKMTLYVGVMTMGVSFPGENVAYSKTFLNLTNDGMATKRFGGDDVLEVVFAEEVPQGGIKAGDTVKFKVLFKGSPLAGESVHATYIGAEATYGGPGEGWVNDSEGGEATTDGDGFVSFTFDHASGWLVGVEYEDKSDDDKGYVGVAMFNVASKGSGGSGSSGGCDAGLGAVLSLSCLTVISAALRKKRG
ncbi:MAG: DUF4198 domain-containing protein [Synergistaceae bacterium]|jgi:uncharacterized GH25 family protein|nr:DUF4198 domain-containing protein [Synergistaceae bacterium]